MSNAAVLEREAETTEVKVVYGANASEMGLKPGTTVVKIRMTFEESMGIPSSASALIGGIPVENSTIVPLGTELVEFLQESGQKG